MGGDEDELREAVEDLANEPGADSARVARLRLAQAVETQFDTSVVAAFEAILAGATEAYRSGSTADFRFTHQEREAKHRPMALSA